MAIKKLKPVLVPWMISPSVPMLSVQSHNDFPDSVTFIGHFKCEEPALDERPGADYEVVKGDPEFKEAGIGDRGAFCMVKIDLQAGARFRTRPAYSDLEVVRRDDFDWSEIAGVRKPSESASQSVKRIQHLWITTGVCPNPRMYEVESSDWVVESGLRLDEGWKHYLLLAHDSFVELIAKGWNWKRGQPVG
jgi:hypothetical protein